MSDSWWSKVRFPEVKGQIPGGQRSNYILNGLIELLMAKGKRLYCAFIDYEKAYDYLNRPAIFAKLINFGLSSKCVNIFKDMSF